MMVLSLWVDRTREKRYLVRNDRNASTDPLNLTTAPYNLKISSSCIASYIADRSYLIHDARCRLSMKLSKASAVCLTFFRERELFPILGGHCYCLVTLLANSAIRPRPIIATLFQVCMSPYHDIRMEATTKTS